MGALRESLGVLLVAGGIALLGCGIGCGKGSSSKSTKVPYGPEVLQVASATEYDAVLVKHPVVLVDFYADWCGPCRVLKPSINELAKEYHGRVAVMAVDVDKLPKVADRYGIKSIPTVILFAGGMVADQSVGVAPKADYAKGLDLLLGKQPFTPPSMPPPPPAIPPPPPPPPAPVDL